MAPHKPVIICELHGAWNSLTVSSSHIPGRCIFQAMVAFLIESTLKPWYSKKSWECLNREGEKPCWTKTQACWCPVASELVGVWGCGFFSCQQGSVVFFFFVLYNKKDCREWFLSDLYWKLCMWILGFFCLMLLWSFHWLGLWAQWDYMKHWGNMTNIVLD